MSDRPELFLGGVHVEDVVEVGRHTGQCNIVLHLFTAGGRVRRIILTKERALDLAKQALDSVVTIAKRERT